jgi:nucleotide-binding universal stress UspA family protein
MFKRIVVPLDGSRLSMKALPYAIEVAKKFGAEAILLRVVQPTIHLTVAGPATMAGVTFEKATQEARLQDKKDEINAGRYLRGQLRMLIDKWTAPL